MMWCPNHGWIYLLELEYVRAYPSTSWFAWHGFDRTLKATSFKNQLDVRKTSQERNVPQVQGWFWVATISKTSSFRCPKFLRLFLPFVSLGSACGLASGRGSRGYTPLHLAARAEFGSHEGLHSVVEQLLDAKAAVDAHDNKGRGLGRGLGGKPLGAWDHCEAVNEDV